MHQTTTQSTRPEIWFWCFEALGLTLNTLGAVLTMFAFQASSSPMQILSEPYPVIDINPNHRGEIVDLCAKDRVLIRATGDSVDLGTSRSCSAREGAHAIAVVTSDYPNAAYWGVICTLLGFLVQAITCFAALGRIIKKF